MEFLIAFISGVIFSIGLIVSQMVDPAKLIGFLDIFGQWDYSLLFVLGGAVGLNLITFRFIKKRKSLIGQELCLPTKSRVDYKIIVGAILFGIGWGLVGVCPGPALVNFITMKSEILILIISMLAGMLLYSFIEKKV
jgi:uncharacterized protein